MLCLLPDSSCCSSLVYLALCSFSYINGHITKFQPFAYLIFEEFGWLVTLDATIESLLCHSSLGGLRELLRFSAILYLCEIVRVLLFLVCFHCTLTAHVGC